MGGYAFAQISPVLTRFLRHVAEKKKGKVIVPLKRFTVVRGDTVFINSGKEKGKRGIVKEVSRTRNTAIVEGLNLAKKHVKSTAEHKGGIFTKEMPIHVSNLQLIDPVQDKPTRVKRGYIEKDGKVEKVRISKLSGSIIPKPPYVPTQRGKDGPLDTPHGIALERSYFPSFYPIK